MVNSSLRPIISFGHICPSIRISLVPVLVPLILLLFHEIVTFMFEHFGFKVEYANQDEETLQYKISENFICFGIISSAGALVVITV